MLNGFRFKVLYVAWPKSKHKRVGEGLGASSPMKRITLDITLHDIVILCCLRVLFHFFILRFESAATCLHQNFSVSYTKIKL